MSVHSRYRSIEGSVVLPNCDESIKQNGLRPKHLFEENIGKNVPSLKILSARKVWCSCYNNLGADWGHYTFPQSTRCPNRKPITISGIERFHDFVEFRCELISQIPWKRYTNPYSAFNSLDSQSARFLVNYTPRCNLWHNLESAKYELPRKYMTRGPEGWTQLMLHAHKIEGKVAFDPTSLKDKCVGEITELIIQVWQNSEEGKEIFHMPWLVFCLKIKDLTWNSHVQDLFFKHRMSSWNHLEVTGNTTREEIQQRINARDAYGNPIIEG